MKSRKMMMVLAVFAALALTAGSAFAQNGQVTLTVGTGTGTTETPVSIPITAVAKTAGVGIAGAAFTVTYDAALTVTVQSSFFDTFVSQGYTEADGLDANGLVEGYDSPLVTNDASGMKIAAARHTAGDISTDAANPTTLFTLLVSSTTAGGPYPINVVATTLNNVDAGYSDQGEQINLLMDANESITDPTDTAAYPVVLAAADTADIVAGEVTFTDFVDSEPDGMDDNWECSFFPGETQPECLTHLQAAPADYDGDGITDVDEYTGAQNDGIQSDPTDPNDPNPQSPCAPMDFNDDGAVNGDDFLMFIGVYPSVVTTGTEIYDLDGNGDINGDDFLLFIGCYPTASVK